MCALEALTEAAPGLFIIDTLETVGEALPWVFEELLARLPAGIVTVLAGRDPLPSRWRTDLEWAPRLRLVTLHNLGRTDAGSLLAGLGVHASEHDEIFAFTSGHPLALALVAESLRNRAVRFDRLPRGDIVHSLVSCFTQEIRDPDRRRALEAACVVRVTNEPLLRALLDRQDCYGLFRWLRERSFFETRDDGSCPHDHVRRAVLEDLRFRDPDWYRCLRERAHGFFEAQAECSAAANEAAQIASIYDLSFLHSHNPLARRFFDWNRHLPLFPISPTADEADEVEAVLREREGDEAVRWFRYWLERQPHACLVFRDHDNRVVGYHCAPMLRAEEVDTAVGDPAFAGARSLIASRGPLRGEEVVIVTRWWLSLADYQAVGPVQSRMWLHMVRTYARTPNLAYAIATFRDVAFWQPIFEYMGFSRTDVGDFALGSHRYGTMHHDFRARPFRDWLHLLARREDQTSPVVAPEAPPSVVVLERAAFEAAVREALRHRGDARALVGNPLLETRLVRERTGASASVQARVGRLRACLDAALDALQSAVGRQKHARAVQAKYGRNAPSQEAAAETLGVPLSSFRRHLKSGVEFIVEYLWQRELGMVSGE